MLLVKRGEQSALVAGHDDDDVRVAPGPGQGDIDSPRERPHAIDDHAALIPREPERRRTHRQFPAGQLIIGQCARCQILDEILQPLLAILRELDGPRLKSDAVQSLHYAAGKVLNDLKRYAEAFHHFNKAKQAAGYKFDIDQYRRFVDLTIQTFTPDLFAARSSYGNPSEAPVFVVGMPRSGTTLVEQICGSHPDVHGAGELSKLRRVANAIGLQPTASDFNKPITTVTEGLSKALAEEHLSYLRERAPTARRIIDKMPHNFELIGLLTLLFPKARIVHCRRDAIDNCVSCFVLPFSSAHSYNSDLRTLGVYYREYDRLMRHWNEVFPGRMFENRYEALVEDQEAQSRRLIDYLDLPWDDACLRFFDREGAVTTPSRWQVRQPIYKSSVKRWKNFEGENGVDDFVKLLIESISMFTPWVFG